MAFHRMVAFGDSEAQRRVAKIISAAIVASSLVARNEVYKNCFVMALKRGKMGNEAKEEGVAFPEQETAQIGGALLKAGLITAEQLNEALRYQKEIGGRLGHILVKLGYVPEEQLLQTLAKQLEIPLFDLGNFTPDRDLLDLFPAEVLERLNAIPLRRELGTLVVGVSDPLDFSALDELRLHAGGKIETVLVSPSKAKDLLNRLFHGGTPNRRSSSGETPRRGRQRLSDLVRELEAEMRAKVDPQLSHFSTDQLLSGLIAVLAARGVVTIEEVETACARLSGRADGSAPTGGSSET